MKKKWEVRYFVAAVASVPIYKNYGKTEAYRQAAKDGWGTVYRDENNVLVCDEDCSASLYTKNGGYFGIFPYEEIDTKEMPKQAECAAIITSDSCGLSFWAEDFSQIHIFVTYEESGLIDTYRVEYGDSQIYDGEVEISFDDLYQQAEGDWMEAYRAELPGTVEYQFKQEADKLAQEAGETWMDAEQREKFRQVCYKIDQIKSARDFHCTMQLIGYDYDKKIINAARKFKKCHNAAQYETERETLDRVAQEAREAAEEIPCPEWMNKAQKEDFREICGLIDTIKSGRDFYRVMKQINGGRYSVDVINAAREFKECFNSAQYEPKQDTPEAAEVEPPPPADKEGGENVARKYRYIDFEDRKRIARLWSIGTPAQAIAEEIGTDPATISRELRRGYPGKDGRNKRPAYNPVIAQKAVEAGIARRGKKRTQAVAL